MEIRETGVYKLSENFFVYGGSFSCTFKEGAVIKITQIDKDYHKIFSPELGDWVFWDIPAQKIA